MTMRDYIAIHAMQGLLAQTNDGIGMPTMDVWYKNIASISYVYADAMIAESQKGKK